MDLTKMDNKNALMSITTQELTPIIKILKLTLIELQYEYSTRTGFYESETEALIKKLEHTLGNKISVTNQEILNIRQTLVEVLFGIDIMDFDSQFDLSRDGLKTLYQVIDRYGKQHGVWE